MKILLTMNLPYTRVYGGANRSNRGLTEALAARHHSLLVVVPALAPVSPITHSQLLEELASEGIHVSSNGEVDVFNLNGVEVHAVIEPSRLYSHLAERIREFKPDWILVSSEDRSQSLLEAALRVDPSRVIYLAHTPQMFPFGPAGLYPGKRRTELIGKASAVVAISRFVADYIHKWTGIESFIHHPPHYGPGPFRQRGRIDTGYVLMMNACAVKGISIFLDLARAMPDIQFAALPGWGTTQAERAALGALGNVVLLENQRNLDDILKRTRALLMPSLWVEGFGMAVVDAMLRGIPVLASNYGGLIEAKLGTDYLLPVQPIERFEDHLDENMLPIPMVPNQDIGPWQDALGRLLSDRALHERQSAVAYAAASNFVSSLTVEAFENFLLGLEVTPRVNREPLTSDVTDRAGYSRAEATSIKDVGLGSLTPEQQALLILRLRRNAARRKKSED
jgi:glycosyltransferase involved in cell wall biosynthesis